MKSILATLMLVSVNCFAISIEDYVGGFRLVKQINLENASARCTDYFSVTHKDGISSFYIDPSYPPLYRAELNGRANPSGGSHSEAGTATKGFDTVRMSKDGKLKFAFEGTAKVFGVPRVVYVANSYSLVLSADKKTVHAFIEEQETFVRPFGKKTRNCVYLRAR